MTAEVEDQVDPAPDPWDRSAETNETERAHAAFLVYRDLPPGIRSARLTAAAVYGVTEQDAKWRTYWGQCQHWSALHLWVERAHAWDEHQASQRAARNVQDILQMRDRHAALATIALSKATEKLRDMKGEDMTVPDLVRLLDVGVKVERLARGAPDQIVAHTGAEGGPIQTKSETSTDPERLVDVTRILEEAGVMAEGSTNAVRDLYGRRGEAAKPEVV